MERNPSFSNLLRSCQRCRSVSGMEYQRPRLLTLFSRIVGITIPSTENFISMQFPFIIDKLWQFEGFIFITAHLKSSCRWVTSCSMCNLDSVTRVTSTITAFIDGPVISLVLISTFFNIISITKTKNNGEKTHPIIMPIFNFCRLVEFIIRKPFIGTFKVRLYEVFNVVWNPKELHCFLK